MVILEYLWCKARCCSDHSSSFWQATGRGAWPPCECPHTSRTCKEPGWTGPEPERSRSGRAGSESDGTYAPAWPHGTRQGWGARGTKTRETAGRNAAADGAERVGQMLWDGLRVDELPGLNEKRREMWCNRRWNSRQNDTVKWLKERRIKRWGS